MAAAAGGFETPEARGIGLTNRWGNRGEDRGGSPKIFFFLSLSFPPLLSREGERRGGLALPLFLSRGSRTRQARREEAEGEKPAVAGGAGLYRLRREACAPGPQLRCRWALELLGWGGVGVGPTWRWNGDRTGWCGVSIRSSPNLSFLTEFST